MVLKDSEHTKEVEFDPIVISSDFDANDDSDEVTDLDGTTVCSFIDVDIDVVVIDGVSSASAIVSFAERLAKHCVSCVKVRLVSC